jgi:hypothetical protein
MITAFITKLLGLNKDDDITPKNPKLKERGLLSDDESWERGSKDEE